MSEVRESEYNGKPLVELLREPGDKMGFKFGLKKAQLIVEHIDDIKSFVAKHGKVPAQVG